MLHFLYQALNSPRGICLQVEGDIEHFRKKLYRERDKATDPDLATLSLQISPTDPTQLWITKNAHTQD